MILKAVRRCTRTTGRRHHHYPGQFCSLLAFKRFESTPTIRRWRNGPSGIGRATPRERRLRRGVSRPLLYACRLVAAFSKRLSSQLGSSGTVKEPSF